MLDKVKELLNKSKQPSSVADNSPIPELVQENGSQVVRCFVEESKELSENANFPVKAKANLEVLIKNLHQIKLELLSFENQAKIERMLSKEIPEVVEVYFSLPKVHAVSVVLENGKTAKETLIEQFRDYANRVETMWTEAIENQSKAMVNQEKMKYKTQEPKKDFFDL